MPWKVHAAVSEVRFALVHSVRSLNLPVAQAARRFGVSRKTAHKWLRVYDDAARGAGPDDSPAAAALADRPRRPLRSPGRTADDVERDVLALRDRHNWGPRKIHFALLRRDPPQPGRPAAGAVPATRTVADILRRHGRVADATAPPAHAAAAPLRFERPGPNELWQLDYKGPVEVARRKLMPLAVLDDHSRYLLAFEPCGDVTMASAWAVLWAVFGEAGLPEQILCDNAFNTMGTPSPAGISWFDSRLARLGIRAAHGRPYHPQTQGKVERLNGTADRELLDFHAPGGARRDCDQHFRDDCRRWRVVYNTLRPHEAIGDVPPLARWLPSPRHRPRELPEPDGFYPAGSTTRTVSCAGTVSLGGRLILCGRGIAGERVRVEDRGGEVAVFYCSREIRRLCHDQLLAGKIL